jgi:hypothetical protein
MVARPLGTSWLNRSDFGAPDQPCACDQARDGTLGLGRREIVLGVPVADVRIE